MALYRWDAFWVTPSFLKQLVGMSWFWMQQSWRTLTMSLKLFPLLDVFLRQQAFRLHGKNALIKLKGESSLPVNVLVESGNQNKNRKHGTVDQWSWCVNRKVLMAPNLQSCANWILGLTYNCRFKPIDLRWTQDWCPIHEVLTVSTSCFFFPLAANNFPLFLLFQLLPPFLVVLPWLAIVIKPSSSHYFCGHIVRK